MSKQNKAHKSNYIQAGRLTPDDLARDQQKQQVVTGSGAGRLTKRKRRSRDKPGPVSLGGGPPNEVGCEVVNEAAVSIFRSWVE